MKTSRSDGVLDSDQHRVIAPQQSRLDVYGDLNNIVLPFFGNERRRQGGCSILDVTLGRVFGAWGFVFVWVGVRMVFWVCLECV